MGFSPQELNDFNNSNRLFTLLKSEILYILSKPDILQLDNLLDFNINEYINERFLNRNFLDTSDHNYTTTVLNEQDLAVFNIIYFYFISYSNNNQITNTYFDKSFLKEYHYYKKSIYDTLCSEKFKEYLPKDDETEDNINNTEKK